MRVNFKFMLAISLLLSFIVFAYPIVDIGLVNYDDGATTTNVSVELNFSINGANLNSSIWNWNGTNYSMYADDLVLMYNFDNVSALGESYNLSDSVIVDISNSQVNASIGQMTAWNQTGRFNGALEFDGVDDFGNFTNSSSFDFLEGNETNFTVTFWFKTNASGGDMTSNNGETILEARRDGTETERAYRFGIHTGGMLGFELGVENKREVINSTMPVNDSKWHFGAGVRNNTNGWKIYVDGVLQDSNTTTAHPTQITKYHIGVRVKDGGALDDYFPGSLDEVRIWARSFSDQEVYQQYISNLNKIDSETWNFYVNQSNNASNTLENGTYTYELFTTNHSGSENSSGERSITIDTSADDVKPVISVGKLNYANGSTTTNTSLEFNFSITENNLNSSVWIWNGTNYTIYNDSLVLMYNFDNVSALGESYNTSGAIVVDISSSENNGTIDNMSIWNSSGKYLGTFELDGLDDYIITPDSQSLNITSEITISFWEKTAADFDVTSTWGMAMVGRGDYGDPRNTMDIRIRATGDTAIFAYEYDTGANSDFAIGSTDIADGNWHYITAKWNGSDCFVYVDGAYENHTYCPNKPGPFDQPFTIGEDLGKANAAQDFFNGSLDEIRIWNRSLSDAEIYQHYASNLNKIDANSWELYINQSKNASSILDDGNYTYQLFGRDNAGNEGSSVERTIIVNAPSDADITDPTIGFIDSTTNASNLSQSFIEANVTASDTNLADITIYLYNSSGLYNSSTQNTSPFFFNSTSLPDGDYSLNATVNDTLGNENFTITRSILLDTTNPTWENNKTDLTSTTSSGSTIYFNITLNDTNSGHYIFSWYNGSAWDNYSKATYNNGEELTVTNTTGISSGKINWTWYFNDSAGNSNQSDVFGVTVSTTNYALSSCTQILSSGVYNITSNINDANSEFCFNISVGHVKLDCLNNTIGANRSNFLADSAVYARNLNNVTVVDCILNYWDRDALQAYNVSNLTIQNISCSGNNQDCLYVRDSNVVNVSSIYSNNSRDAVDLRNSAGVHIDTITSVDNIGAGVVVSDTPDLVVSTVSCDDEYKCISLVDLENASISHVYSINSDNDGFGIESVHNSTFLNITLISSMRDGFEIEDSTGNNITDANISGSRNKGLKFEESSNILVHGFYSENVVDDSIDLYKSNYINLTNLEIVDADADGLSLYKSDYLIIDNATIIRSTDDGIQFYKSHFSVVTNSFMNGSGYEGIYLYKSSNINVTESRLEENEEAGLYLSNSLSNSLFVDGVNSTDNIADGFYVGNGDWHILSNVIANNNGQDGIDVRSSADSVITNTTSINNTEDGFYAEDLVDSNLTKVSTKNNDRYGVVFQSSSSNILVDSEIIANVFAGIDLSTSSGGNQFYNNFLNNSNNVVLGSLDLWNTSQTSATNIIGRGLKGGNVWTNPTGSGFSDTCADINLDSICDDNYTISGSNIDYLPLAIEDSGIPTIQLTSPANRSFVNGNVSILVTASDARSGIGNVTIQQKNSSTAYSIICTDTASPYLCIWGTDDAADGENFFVQAIAYDKAGNNASVVMNYTVDKNVPFIRNISVILPGTQSYVRNNQTVVISLEASDSPDVGSGINITLFDLTALNSTGNITPISTGSLASGQWSTWNISVNVSATTGTKTIPITLYDNATGSNNIRVGEQFYVTVDNDAPSYLDVINSSLVYNNENVSFSVNVIDNNLFVKYIFSTNINGSWVNTTVEGLSLASYTISETRKGTTGNYSYQFYLYDDAGNANSTVVYNFTVLGTKVVPIDTDSDSINDANDRILWNATNVTATGTSNLGFFVGNIRDPEDSDGIQDIIFNDSSDQIVNFTFNFSLNQLDLSNISIIKETNSLVINLEGQLQSSFNKTIILVDNNFVSLCVKDAEINSSSEISSGCDGLNETDFTSCLGGDLFSSGINCTDIGSTIIFENLRNSAVRGIPAAITSDASTSSATSTTGGSSWGICGDGLCNDGEVCADQETENHNGGSCFEDCGLCAEQALADEVGVDDVTKFEFQNDEIKKEAVEDGDGENDNKEDIFKEIFLDLGWMWTVLVVVVVLSGIFVSLWRHHGRTVAGQK